MLWAAQGISSREGLRTSPSAGALYPLEIHIVTAGNEELEPGVYRYVPEDHILVREITGDIREAFESRSLPANDKKCSHFIVISAVYARITSKYGNRGFRYTNMEAGHVAQNIYLWEWNLG